MLQRARLIRDTDSVFLYGEETLLVTITPGRLVSEHLVDSTPYSLSRMAYLQVEQGLFVVRAPRESEFNVVAQLHDARLLPLLQGQAVIPTFSQEIVDGFYTLFNDLGLTGNKFSDRYDAWTFRDRVAHFATVGQSPARYPAPPLKPSMSEQIIALSTPAPPLTMSLGRALEQRRTIYQYDRAPVTIHALSDLLYHSARVKAFVRGSLYDSTVRPYPSAGATYGLEIYVWAVNCTDLSGFFHYAPDRHVLEVLPHTLSSELIDALIQETGSQIDAVQTALFITARMQRINWKARALALAHQDAGVLMQTIYLVATALSLAPCALGGEHQALFASGTDIAAADEPLISTFLLGASH